MRLIKTLGLAAIATMAAMAFIGATSASATVLCKETATGGKCPESQTYHQGAIIEGTAEDARLTPGGTLLPDVVCEHSTTEAEITDTGGAEKTVKGTIWNLDFTGCETDEIVPTSCKVTVENLPYDAEVHSVEDEHNGIITVKSHGTGDPSAIVLCSGVIECTFGNELFELPVNGGNPAHVTAAQVPLTIYGGNICPTTAQWDATYVAVGENTSIWVGEEEVPGI